MKTIKAFADDENHQGLALWRTEAVKCSVGDWNSVSLL